MNENLGNVYVHLSEYEAARAAFDRALAIRERMRAPGDPELAYSVVGLGTVALGQHRYADAVELSERALAVQDPTPPAAETVVEAEFVLARALVVGQSCPARSALVPGGAGPGPDAGEIGLPLRRSWRRSSSGWRGTPGQATTGARASPPARSPESAACSRRPTRTLPRRCWMIPPTSMVPRGMVTAVAVRRDVRSVLGATVVVILGLSAEAHAGPPPSTDPPAPADDSQGLGKVVLVRAHGDAARWSEAEQRTMAELRAVGFEVVLVSLDDDDEEVARQRLQGLARANEALAAVHLWRASAGGEAEIWLVDRVTGKTSIRHVDVSDATPGEADEILAVRVVELLRASLLDIDEPTVHGEVKPSPALERFVPARPPAPTPRLFAPRFGVRGGFSVAGTPGGLGAMAGPSLGAMVAFGPRRRLSLDLDAYATAVQARVVSDAGDARVGVAMARFHFIGWPRADKRVSPGIGAGIGMLVGWTRGQGQGGYQGRRDATIVALPSTAFDLAVAIVPRVRFRIGLRVGMTFPRLRVVLPGSRTVGAGWPMMDGFFAIEWVG